MRSPEARWLWAAQLTAIALAALYALYFQATLPSKLPAEDDHRRAAEHLAQNARPGDAVLLFPWWTERARLFAPDGVEVVGYLGSDGDALVRHPRIWVLAQPRLPRADDDAFWRAFNPGRTKAGETLAFGTLELTLFENGRHRPVVFSAPEAAARAAAGSGPELRVYLESPDGAQTPCVAARDAFRCPGAPHVYVRSEWHEVLYQPRRCLFMPAPGGPRRLVAEFADAALGEEALLEAGVIWEHAWKRGAGLTPTSVSLEDAATGARLADVAIAPGVEGFQRSRVERATARAVRIAVSSQNPEGRQICVDLTAFGPRGSGS